MKAILAFLKKRRINYSRCADKNDIVDLVCEVYHIPMDIPERTVFPTSEAPTTSQTTFTESPSDNSHQSPNNEVYWILSLFFFYPFSFR